MQPSTRLFRRTNKHRTDVYSKEAECRDNEEAPEVLYSIVNGGGANAGYYSIQGCEVPGGTNSARGHASMARRTASLQEGVWAPEKTRWMGRLQLFQHKKHAAQDCKRGVKQVPDARSLRYGQDAKMRQATTTHEKQHQYSDRWRRQGPLVAPEEYHL